METAHTYLAAIAVKHLLQRSALGGCATTSATLVAVVDWELRPEPAFMTEVLAELLSAFLR